MEEIGGYIEFENYRGRMLHEDGILLNCGRRALSYLIEANDIKKIWLPKLICDSVIEPFKKANADISFYKIEAGFKPILDKVPETDWIVVINYYGQLLNEYLGELAEKYKNIIIDNTMAYFQEPIPGVNTFYTCRKFFGVTDGAVLYSNKRINRTFDIDESYQRMIFLLGRYERSASEFYELYTRNNEIFNDEPVKTMSKLTNNILKSLDYDYIKKRREKNFSILDSALKEQNTLELNTPDGPFMYPLLIADGNDIKKKLINKKIYVPTLWPEVLNKCREDEIEYQLAKNIVPLPIDQRYSEEDMVLIAKTIKELLI